MFKFDFQLEEEELDQSVSPAQHDISRKEEGSQNALAGPSRPRRISPCTSISLDELLETLPDKISYSPIDVPGVGGLKLLRRDLFDARFQVAHEDLSSTSDLYEAEGEAGTGGDGVRDDKPTTLAVEKEGQERTDGMIDASSDLIPGLYEGGLKTWEGGVDLVQVLSGVEDVGRWVQGARSLEVGCGTALPSVYLLRAILSASNDTSITPSTTSRTTLHMQDYNRSVLSLVTLPNLLLAALPFIPPESLRPAESVEDVETVIPDLDIAGDVIITPQLKEGFKRLLSDRGVDLMFTFGSWSGLAETLKGGGDKRHDLVLTAETIYSEDSVEDLIDVLRGSTGASLRKGDAEAVVSAEKEVRSNVNGVEVELELETGISTLDVQDKDKDKAKDQWDSVPLRDQARGAVLVGAKVLYFGVGGDLQSFLDRVERSGGWWETVKEWTVGVGRKVVRVGW